MKNAPRTLAGGTNFIHAHTPITRTIAATIVVAT